MPGKSVLIIGDTGGLGASLAQKFRAAGDQVYGASRTAPDPSKDPYPRFQVNAAVEADVVGLSSTFRSQGINPDIVINCAGLAVQTPLLLSSAQSFHDVVASNLTSAFLISREFAKTMMAGGGLIVNFSSIHVTTVSVGTGAYAASKSAIETLTRVLNNELARTKVKVVCLALSYVEDVGMAGDVDRSIRDAVLSEAPAGRMIGVGEVFDTIVKLADPATEADEPVVNLGI